MDKHTTKYFGEVELWIDEDDSWADFDILYDGQVITISFSDYSFFKDKIIICWEMIDKYVEINEIAKKAIIEYFPKNGFVMSISNFILKKVGLFTMRFLKVILNFCWKKRLLRILI